MLRIWRAILVVVDSCPMAPDLVFTGLALRCFWGDWLGCCCCGWLWLALADVDVECDADAPPMDALIEVGVNMAFVLLVMATTGMLLWLVWCWYI